MTEIGGNSGIRDQVLAGILERIRNYRETGDPEVILCPEAAWEATALTGPKTGLDVEAYGAAADLYWLRYRAKERGEKGSDLAAALRLYAAILDAPDGGPERVPMELRLILENQIGQH